MGLGTSLSPCPMLNPLRVLQVGDKPSFWVPWLRLGMFPLPAGWEPGQAACWAAELSTEENKHKGKPHSKREHPEHPYPNDRAGSLPPRPPLKDKAMHVCPGWLLEMDG